MKKILMIVALAIATVGVASAQLGVKVDANASFSNFYGEDADPGILIGYRAGAAVEIPFAGELSTGQFFFSPGLVFQSKGAKVKDGGDASLRIHYVKVPLLVGARFQFADNMGVSLQFGPYAGYGLSAKASAGSVDMDLYQKVPASDKAPLKRFDAGATISAAIEFSRLYVQVGTDIGLMKIGNEFVGVNAFGKTKNIDFFVGAGYRF